MYDGPPILVTFYFVFFCSCLLEVIMHSGDSLYVCTCYARQPVEITAIEASMYRKVSLIGMHNE